MMETRDAAAYASFAFIIALIYANVLFNGFVWDDRDFILDAHDVSLWDAVSSPSTHGLYRPGRQMAQSLFLFAFGIDANAYHLHAMGLHVICTLLVFAISKKILPGFRYALIAGMVFAAHPIHTARVANMTASFDLYGIAFSLLAFLAYLHGGRGHIASIAFFAVGLAFSEEALTVPPLILAHGLLFSPGWPGLYPKAWKSSDKRIVSAMAAAPHFGAGLVFLTFRGIILGGISRTSQYSAGSLWGSILAIPGIVASYLVQLVLPVSLTICHTPHFPGSMGDQGFIVPAVVLALGTALALRGKKHISFSVLWFFVTLLPFLNLIPQVTPMADRYLYLPSAGYAMFLAGLVHALDMVWARSSQRLATGAVIIMLLMHFVWTMDRNRDFLDESSLWEATIRTNPDCTMAYINLGDHHLSEGEHGLAIALYEKARHARGGPKAKSSNAHAINNIAVAYAMAGDCESSLASYAIAEDEGLADAVTYANKARTLEDCGDILGAAKAWEQVTKLDPTVLFAYKKQAELYDSIGEKELAVGALKSMQSQI